jgi:1-phosphatidylinositol phosphodiesterase
MHPQKLFFLVLSISTCSFAHWDPAYFRKANDGFDFGRKNWMKKICGDILLSEMALPGTHDSGSFKEKGGHAVTTQCLDFYEQLSVGIRMFDIRIRHVNDQFILQFGMDYVREVTFNEFLETAENFLLNNPSETILFRLNQEKNKSTGNTRSINATLELYLKDHEKAYLKTTNHLITLSQARGKFIMFINESDFKGFGINYEILKEQNKNYLDSNWGLYPKWDDVKSHLKSAVNPENNEWYINYLSAKTAGFFPYFVASGRVSPETGSARLETGLTTPGNEHSYPDFPRINCNSISKICTIAFEGINVLTRDKILEINENSLGKRSVGIIMADFPGDSLIKEIIKNNHKIC